MSAPAVISPLMTLMPPYQMAGDGNGGKELDDERRQHGRQPRRRHESPEIAVILDDEPLDFKIFPVKGADDTDAGNRFFQKGRDIGHLPLYFMTGLAQPPAKEADGKDDERYDDQCQQCQLPIQIQHGNEGTYEDDCFLDKGNEVAGNGRLQCRNVICQIAHDIASLALVKIGKGQGLQMTI